ncbi:hypothetical protein FACS189485_15100 [Spirochaetia bacterium]|nr:hypothetical protein FACS189485_15100 [Spirochaetia bacterium]
MKTVFVIGAGAGVDIGMPTGQELKDSIIDILKVENYHSKNTIVDDALGILSTQSLSYNKDDEIAKCTTNDGKLRYAANIISSGLPLEISIDNFLDKHQDNEYIVYCGKLAIAFAVIRAEKKSYLYNRDSSVEIKVNNVRNTWYVLFFQKITENCLLTDLPKRLQNITFIIFNYDRCFEQFFCYALMKNYAIDKGKAREIIKNMNIIHPYGTVDKFDKSYFGDVDILNGAGLIQLSKNIKTFTEHVDQNSNDYIKMTSACKEANRIIFLGFAYHKQNIKLLYPDPIPHYPSNDWTHSSFANDMPKFLDIYGTGFGISDNDRVWIQDMFKRIDGRVQKPDISNNDCKNFFTDFWYRISFNSDEV